MENNVSDAEKTISQVKDDTFKLLPLIPIWLTIIGAAKLYYYYKPYKINIFAYLDFQEVLLLSINDLYTFVLSTSSLFIINFLSSYVDSIDQKLDFDFSSLWRKLPNSFIITVKIIQAVFVDPIVIISIIIVSTDYFSPYDYPKTSAILVMYLAFSTRNKIYRFF